MEIKTNNNKQNITFFLINKFNRYRFLILICSILSFSGGVLLQRNGVPGIVLTFFMKVSDPLAYFRSRMTKPERLVLNIKHNNFEKIAKKRKEALERRILIKKSDDWVSATISHRGKSINTKIRLKGIMYDHWDENDMWSLDIKIVGDNRILGMKRFSIMHPKTRWELDEWVTHKLYQFAELYTLKSDFVSVSINGSEERIYNIEDRGNPSTISTNSLREGLLLKADLDFAISQEFERDGGAYTHYGALNATSPTFFKTEFVPVNKQTIAKNIELTNQFNQAKNLIELFRLGKIKPKEAFDLKKMSLFFALNDLLGHQHPSSLGNIKFYYNPITSLIEPVGNDIGGIRRLSNSPESEDFTTKLLAETIFTTNYNLSYHLD